MNVYVLSGGAGGSRCHVEVFEDTEIGLKYAEQRRNELRRLNNGCWDLTIERCRVKVAVNRR